MGKLFGSPARVRLMRLFVFSPDFVGDRDAVALRIRCAPAVATRELTALARTGLIRRRTFFKETGHAGRLPKKRRAIGWTLDPAYSFLTPLRAFLTDTVAVSHEDVRKRLRPAGALRLLVLTGIFTGTRESALDMLIVADKLNEQALGTAIRHLEADFGRDIRYTVLTTEEYLFRKRVRDKLIRDVLDFPHALVIDRVPSA